MKNFSSLSLLFLLTGCLTQNPIIELAPTEPTSLTVSPASPSNDTTPTVSGETAPNVSVILFSGPGCSGSILATGYASNSGQFSLTSGELPTGTYDFSVRATNARGALCSASSVAYNLTATPPVVSVTKDPNSPALIKTTDTVNYIVEYTDADHVSLAVENVLINRTGTVECTDITITDSTTSTPHVAITGCSGDGTFGISIAEGTATNLAGSSLPSNVSSTVTVDNTGISSASFDLPAGTYQAMPLNLVITFPEALNVLGPSALTASGTCSGLPQISIGEKTSPNTVNVILTAPTCGPGDTVVLNIDFTKITDSAGNIGVNQLSETYIIDTVGPTSATFSPEASRVKEIPATIIVTFNEKVDPNTVKLADFSVSGCGSTPPTLSLGTVSEDMAEIILTDGVCADNETLELTVDFSTIEDTLGTPGTSSDNVIYTYDIVGPVATPSMTPATATMASISDPFSVTVNFSEEVLLDSIDPLTDLSITGDCTTLPTTVLTSTEPGTDISFNLIGASCTDGQTLTVSLDGASITDSAGNVGTGVATAAYIVDQNGPSVASVSPVEGIVGSIPPSVTFTFSEDLDPATVDISDFSIAGSCDSLALPTMDLVSFVSGKDVTINLTGGGLCAEASTVVLTVATTGIKDIHDNSGTTSFPVTYTLASPGPVVLAISPINTLPESGVTVSFNENVESLSVDASDFDVSASTCADVAISFINVVGSDINFDVTATCNNSGDEVKITFNGINVTDPAGNVGSGSQTVTYTHP